MPIHDRFCPTCGWVKADCYQPRVKTTVLCPDGHETDIVYVGGAAAVHGDDKYIGGLTLENLAHEPVTVYSRSEYKRELAPRGLQEFVRHVDPPEGQRAQTRPWHLPPACLTPGYEEERIATGKKWLEENPPCS
jgi:hypothetical protein